MGVYRGVGHNHSLRHEYAGRREVPQGAHAAFCEHPRYFVGGFDRHGEHPDFYSEAFDELRYFVGSEDFDSAYGGAYEIGVDIDAGNDVQAVALQTRVGNKRCSEAAHSHH